MTCQRCGACCLDGGPALHQQDLGLLTPDPGGVRPHLDITELMVLRKGEPVRDQPEGGGLKPLDVEIVKIRGRDGSWTCLFYDEQGNACGRYAWRPQECRRQDCQATEAIAEYYTKDRVTRFDIMREGGKLAELAYAHESRCGVPQLAERALAFRRGDAQAGEAILHMLTFDHSAREVLAEVGGADVAMFVLGRPLFSMLSLFGLAVEQAMGDGDAGAPVLVKSGLWRYPMGDDGAGVPTSMQRETPAHAAGE